MATKNKTRSHRIHAFYLNRLRLKKWQFIGLGIATFLYTIHSFYNNSAALAAETASLLQPMAIGTSDTPWFYQGITQFAYAGVIIWIIVLLQRSGK